MNKKFETIIIVFLIIIITSTLDWIIFIVNKIPLLSISGIASIGDKILFATFLALIWYAWETKKIREIEQEPIIDLYYRPQTRNHGKCLRLRNSGKGTAYNIKVERISVRAGEKEFEFYFGDPNLILMYNEEKTLWVQSKYDHKNSRANYQIEDQALDNFLSYVKGQAIKHKAKVKIIVSYKNYLHKKIERQFYFYHRLHLNYDEIYKKEFEVELVK